MQRESVRRGGRARSPSREAGRAPRFALPAVRRWPAVLMLTLAVGGCHEEGPTEPRAESPAPPAPAPAPPATSAPDSRDSIVIVSGDGQQGFARDVLPESLVVRVTDAGGTPVQHAVVQWKVTAGSGRLDGSIVPSSYSSAVTLTDQDGVAYVRLEPYTLWWTSVTATLSSSGRAVTFNAYATGIAVHFLWGSGWTPKNLTVPVGTPIEWALSDMGDWFSLPPHLVSTEVPQGGAAINERSWERFRFVPNVRGTWRFEYRYTDPDTDSTYVDGPYNLTAQ